MTNKSILLDTSAVVALLDISDAYHNAIEPYWQEHLFFP